MNSLVKTRGTVQYRGLSCVLELSKDFGDYYYSLIPKYKNAHKQKYNAHVTIVREFEQRNNLFSKEIYKNHIFYIDYSSYIWNVSPYFFLKCWSPQIEYLRAFYGLRPYRFGDCYHITIGNTK